MWTSVQYFVKSRFYKNNGRYRETVFQIAKQRLKMKNNAGYTKTTLDTRKQRF